MEFKEAYELPIGNHVEKKGKFSYLSWTFAVKFLRENYPDATWKVKELDDGTPAFKVGNGYMVCCTVFVDEKGYTQWHPVIDNRNKPIMEPTSFDINTAIQRCLTKAIAISTGIGLGLYAGEDLPTEGQQAIDDADNKLLDSLMASLDKCSGADALKKWGKSNKAKVESLPADLKSKVYLQFTQINQIFEADENGKS